MNRARLLHAREIMAGLTPKQFDMERWFEDLDNPMDCGTAACWLGWCVRDRKFRRAGLHVDNLSFPVTKSGAIGAYAAEEFFRIPIEDAQNICHPATYRAKRILPKHVIAKIDALLAREG